MTWVLEWDSIIGLCCITYLFNLRTVNKEIGLVRNNKLFSKHFSSFSAFVAYVLPYFLLFHPKLGIGSFEYLQAGKQICFHKKTFVTFS